MLQDNIPIALIALEVSLHTVKGEGDYYPLLVYNLKQASYKGYFIYLGNCHLEPTPLELSLDTEYILVYCSVEVGSTDVLPSRYQLLKTRWTHL